VRNPDNRYHDIFKLQGLTRISLALHLYSRVGDQSVQGQQRDGELHRRALKCSRVAADFVLRHILRILNSADNESFETDIHPPSKFIEQFKALLNRGPVRLDRWNFFYGLLDCAARICSITIVEEYPAGFEVRMRSIIAKSREVSLRLKTVSNPSS
jgi:hypothetical protein